MNSYDVAILGAGPGGYFAAIRGTQLGAKVVVIEREEVGGTCLNWGCIPTKSLIASVEAYTIARRGGEFGFVVSGEVKPDLAAMVARKEKVVDLQVKGIRGLFQSNGVTLLEGEGRLVAAGRLLIQKKGGGQEDIEARKVIIATGSRPADLPNLPLDGQRILSSTEALALTEIPRSLLIVGAGVIGCEFAFLFNGLGCEVTMVEMLSHALPLEDEDISRLLERELRKRKIQLHTEQRVEGLHEDGEGNWLAVLSGGQEVRAEKILVSVGRQFNGKGIGLETLGIPVGSRGEIPVNERMETDRQGIYAIGDVVGGTLLAHVASKGGMVAAANALGGNERLDLRVVPNAIFTHPEIGSVGLKERQAREMGYAVKVGRVPYRALGKSHALGEITGEVKIVAAADSGELLGVHILGPCATELIHEAALALSMEATVEEVAEMIHAHPTLAELLMEAAHDLMGRAIHLPKKNPL